MKEPFVASEKEKVMHIMCCERRILTERPRLGIRSVREASSYYYTSTTEVLGWPHFCGGEERRDSFVLFV